MSANTFAPVSPRTEAARRVLRALLADDQPGAACVTALATLGVPWLRQQGLAALAWVRCRQSLPAELATPLRAAYFAAAADDVLHRHELQTVLQTLVAQDILPVVFKGATFAYTLYPDPACRSMGDLDLWIGVDELPHAQAALEAIGYSVSHNPDRPTAFKELNGVEIQLIGQTPAGLVELHGGVFVGEWLRLTARVDEAAVWERAARTVLLDQPARRLTPEDAILQLLVHVGINHQYSMAVLRSLIDMALLARAAPLDWTAVVDRAQEWRIATVTWLGLALAIDLAGLSEARAIMPRLAPSRLRQACLARLVNVERIVAQTDVRDSRLRFILLLFLVDRPRDLLKLIGRTLWPERAWLQARYGNSTFLTGLQHLFDAVRGKI